MVCLNKLVWNLSKIKGRPQNNKSEADSGLSPAQTSDPNWWESFFILLFFCPGRFLFRIQDQNARKYLWLEVAIHFHLQEKYEIPSLSSARLTELAFQIFSKLQIYVPNGVVGMAAQLTLLGLQMLYYRMLLQYYHFLVRIGVSERILVGIRAKLVKRDMFGAAEI